VFHLLSVVMQGFLYCSYKLTFSFEFDLFRGKNNFVCC